MSEKLRGKPQTWHMSPWLARAVELLQEKPLVYDVETLGREVRNLVPAGRAMRENEKSRLHSGGPAKRKYPLTEDAIIEIGARQIVLESIKNALKRGTIVEEKGKLRLGGPIAPRRLCPHCGKPIGTPGRTTRDNTA